MNEPTATLLRILPDALDALIVQAHTQVWTELALLGPDFPISAAHEEWPYELKRYRRVYQLAEFVDDLGARIGTLTDLTSLYLSGNKLGEVGAKHLSALTNLTSLVLDDNNLGAAGAKQLAALTSLTSLNLSGNKLGEAGAKHLSALTSLTSLNLWNNKLGDAGAKHLSALTSLTSLNLSSNNLGEAGAKHLAALTSLTTLNLSSNNLGDLTPLAGLPMVHTLNVSSTRVANLAPLVGLIEKGVAVRLEDYGEGILVRDCPLTHPPPEVVKAGRDAVLNYVRETKAQGVDKLFEAKVLLVGEGRAGKTSLLRRLYQPELPLPREDETTKGIDIHLQDFPLADGRSFRLNVWDFGGQEIYHATHQFFLTKRSLYILLDDTAKDYTTVHDPGFKYWLEVIELLSESSPVLIFQNEKGGRSKRIDVAGIMGRFPNVKEVYHGDLQRPNAADEVREAIQFHVQQLPHVGDEIPAKWVSIRAEIEARAQYESYISEAAYFDIYRHHLEFDRNKARHLSLYLHDLGVFLHFQDHPLLRHTVILENEWATAAVFRVLDNEQTKAALGRFTREDCAQIWRDSTYADMHAELLALMERFELCYPLPDSRPTTWLAPQLLPPSMPDELTNWASADDLVLSYRYSFLPKGLISRLIVRMHRYVKRPELAWTSGALFEREATQLLVQTTAHGDEVVLRARGPERKALLSVIAADLDALNATFGALDKKVEKRVPCICSLCRESSRPEFFDERKLLKRKQANQTTVQCDESYEDVSVLALLDGLKFEHLPSWAHHSQNEPPADEVVDIARVKAPVLEPQAAQKTVQIFLASSEELMEDRDAFDLYFRQQNDWLRKEGLYLKVIRWENFIDAMSDTRLQDEYNEAVRRCDIFVSLFSTKAGKYTEEEFDVAYQTYKATMKRPRVYTFFKNTQFDTASVDREALKSLWAFQDKLKQLGHFYTEYNDIEHLKRQFSDQLRKLREEDKLPAG